MPRGGARKGAGRKPSPETRKVPYAMKISQDIHAYLKEQDNATETIETAIRRSKAFREWKK